MKHSDGPVTIRLRSRPGVVRVGVMDNHPEFPDPLPCTTDQDFGRGLFLVEAMADAWGMYPVRGQSSVSDGWKVVWFELFRLPAAHREAGEGAGHRITSPFRP